MHFLEGMLLGFFFIGLPIGLISGRLVFGRWLWE